MKHTTAGERDLAPTRGGLRKRWFDSIDIALRWREGVTPKRTYTHIPARCRKRRSEKNRVVNTEDAKLWTDPFRGTTSVRRWNMKQSIGVNSGRLMGYGPIRWEGSGLSLNVHGSGLHHHYSTRYTPLYLAEACYKNNYRGTNIFAKFLTERMESG